MGLPPAGRNQLGPTGADSPAIGGRGLVRMGPGKIHQARIISEFCSLIGKIRPKNVINFFKLNPKFLMLTDWFSFFQFVM